jgi:sulfide dehydrogenase [flavocytochrome c] flavoprotein subunit
MVTDIDASKKTITLENGNTLKYDRLVVSPGIDFKYSAIEGYSKEVAQKIPHAFQAGPQTTLLYNQLREMKQGGTFVISAPKRPYRCPPGPYERASVIAEYFKKNNPTAKIIILDSKKKFPKKKQFEEGWKILYGDMIKWVSAKKGGNVTKVDSKTMTVYSKYGNIKADVINLIPPQNAGALAFSAGLTNKAGWCPVKAHNFESKIHKDIHVIGDSCFVGQMPKSAHSSGLQAKTCAAAIVSDFNNFTTPTLINANACYSLIGEHYGVSVVAAFKLKNGKYVMIKDASGAAPVGKSMAFRSKEADYARGWYKSITADIWG